MILLEIKSQSRLAQNSWSFCCHFPSVRFRPIATLGLMAMYLLIYCVYEGTTVYSMDVEPERSILSFYHMGLRD